LATGTSDEGEAGLAKPRGQPPPAHGECRKERKMAKPKQKGLYTRGILMEDVSVVLHGHRWPQLAMKMVATGAYAADIRVPEQWSYSNGARRARSVV
jgi:hypothetical protein